MSKKADKELRSFLAASAAKSTEAERLYELANSHAREASEESNPQKQFDEYSASAVSILKKNGSSDSEALWIANRVAEDLIKSKGK